MIFRILPAPQALGPLGSSPNPAWYYLHVATSGNIDIHIHQESSSDVGLDVDFICWGPFSSVSAGCATGGGIPSGSGVDWS